MRIVLVSSSRGYGGAEKRLLQNAREFRRHGHAVTVVGHPDGQVVARARAEELPIRAAVAGRIHDLPALLRLRAILLAERPDVVIAYSERSVQSAALALRLAGSRAALVNYFPGTGLFRDRPTNRRLVAPRVTRFVANAEATRRELLAFRWIPPERLTRIYDGIDPAPIEAADPAGVREELGASPGETVALVVARLVASKGHAELLEATAARASRLPGLHLWIAGDGPEAPALRERVARLGLKDRVRLLGFRDDIPRLLRAADLLCHPSRKEGAPQAVLEAMVAGLPVVAAAAHGTPEYVLDGETGFLYPPGRTDELADRLEALVVDPALRRRLGLAGRCRALERFSEDRCTREWLELLEACIDAAAARRTGPTPAAGRAAAEPPAPASGERTG